MSRLSGFLEGDGASGSTLSPRVDQNQCLRSRCNSFDCTHCRQACPSGAIELAPTVAVDREACTRCMLCTASCPAGALEEETLDLSQLLARLKDLEQPVIGCKAGPEVRAHARVECLGGLSEEHLIALGSLFPRPVQLNATSCGDCKNGFVIDAVERKLDKLRRLGLAGEEKGVLLRKSEQTLIYREREWNRRSFLFPMRRRMAPTEADRIPPRDENQSVARGKKFLPYRRKLLNAVLAQLPPEQYERLYAEYYYGIALGENCDSCGRCAAMCPTGALFRKRVNGQKHVGFRPLLCSGCGLCATFCPLDAIEVRQAGGKAAARQACSA